MKLNQLVCKKEVIGYRLSEIPNSNVSLDMTKELAKELLSCIDKSKVRKGLIVEMKLKGNVYISENEQNTIEVSSLKECLSYINGVKSSEGILNEEFNNTNEEKKRLREELNNKFFNQKDNCYFEDLEHYILYYTEVKEIAEKFRIASSGVGCKVIGFMLIEKWDSKVKFDVHFPNLLEVGKFLHNWYSSKENITMWVGGQTNVKNTSKSLSDFLITKMGLPDGYYYEGLSDVKCLVQTEDFTIDIYGDICLTLYKECSVPGYNLG